jgi:hypothetical protein
MELSVIMPANARICACCQINRVALPAVCRDCELHQGNTGPKMQRRDRDHVSAWRNERARWTAQAERKITRLEEQVEQLQTKLNERPVHVVHENLDAETVKEAESDRDAAYRSRDKAMQFLCQVRLLHQERIPGKCTCYKNYSECKTAQVVGKIQMLSEWEGKQVTRMRMGYSHYLPDNHPAMLDRRHLT